MADDLPVVRSLEDAAQRLRTALDLLAQFREVIAPVDNALAAQSKAKITTGALATGIETYTVRIAAYRAKVEALLARELPDV
jgi:hypothetical protein